MEKSTVLLSFVLILLMSGCGTSTNSGGSSINNSSDVDDSSANNNTTPTENNSSNVDNSSANNNTTPTKNNSSSNTDSIFNTSGAVYDAKACGAFSGYSAITDSSLTPEGQEDSNNAIAILSSYRFTSNPADTQVTLYYPTLKQTKQGKPFVSLYSTFYTISFDKAWINNTNNEVYVKTPKDNNGKYGCYRYELNDTNTSNITATQVYR